MEIENEHQVKQSHELGQEQRPERKKRKKTTTAPSEQAEQQNNNTASSTSEGNLQESRVAEKKIDTALELPRPAKGEKKNTPSARSAGKKKKLLTPSEKSSSGTLAGKRKLVLDRETLREQRLKQ